MRIYVKSAEGLNSKQRIRIARTSTDPKELSRLAYDDSRLVRLKVFQNKNTPKKTIEMLALELANDADKDVREQVAQNPSTPPEALVQLANDESFRLRREVANHPSTPPEVLAQLADDEDYSVRSGVAKKSFDSCRSSCSACK